MAAISKQLDELLLWLRSERTKRENLQVDALPYSSQLSDSSGFNRPDPKPIYEIKADKEIPKASSKSKRRYKLQKRISCEELDERTMKGLCVFYGEQETPYHRLQHKNDVILMIDSEDHLSDSMVNKIGNVISSDRWLSNSIGCELENGETDNEEDRVPSDSDLVAKDIKKENPEDQALNDEELVETEVATKPISQLQVHISKLEPSLRFHNASPDVCEDFKSLVGVDDHVKARVVLLKKSAGMTINQVAHQLFDQMPSKEKQRKCLKAWKFKFKSTSKRSKSMDDMFSFVEETALLKKDPKETIWDCVKKEFKETMAACGKNRVDRFKLAEEKESRLQVLDMNQTFMYHQIGHGVDILLAFKMQDHDKEMAVVLQRSTSLTIRDCPDISSRANRVWKPGGLLCVQDHSGGSILMITQPFHGLHLQRIICMDMKFQEVIVDDVFVLSVMVCLCVPNKKFEAGLEIYGCETKKQMLLIVKLANRVWDSGGSLLESVDEESFGDDRSREVIAELNSYTGLTHLDKSDFRRFDGDKIKEWLFKVEEFFSIDFTPMELKVKLASNHFEGQLLRQFQELFEKLSLASMMFEQTFSSITEPKKILPSFFRLKHKWRSRLSHSFSEMKQRMIGRVWKSFGYLMEDMMEEDQKQQGDNEPLVIVPDFDAKVCVTFDQYIRRKGSVGADRETKNNQPTLTFLRSTKQSYLSLRDNRVWDPGGSLVDAATPCLLSLHFTTLHFITAILSFLKKP